MQVARPVAGRSSQALDFEATSGAPRNHLLSATAQRLTRTVKSCVAPSVRRLGAQSLCHLAPSRAVVLSFGDQHTRQNMSDLVQDRVPARFGRNIEHGEPQCPGARDDGAEAGDRPGRANGPTPERAKSGRGELVFVAVEFGSHFSKPRFDRRTQALRFEKAQQWLFRKDHCAPLPHSETQPGGLNANGFCQYRPLTCSRSPSESLRLPAWRRTHR